MVRAMSSEPVAVLEGSVQLALKVGLRDEATFENFYARDSLAPLLDSMAHPFTEPLQFLHGSAGEGKSHLLQALCHATQGAVYLPLADVHTLPPEELFRDLESAAVLALDGLELIAGRQEWEESLFHLVNRARAANCPIWVAARRPAVGMIQLPDLSSRLAGGVTWAIAASSDEEKLRVLQFRAQRRGLNLPDAVALYLCARQTRALTDLMEALDRLDGASLQLQRPLTVPLVREVMGW